MLMRLDLAKITEAAGLAEEDREDIKLLVMFYILELCNNQPHSLVVTQKLTLITPCEVPLVRT